MWKAKLEQRGILHAAELAFWEPYQNFWRYPLFTLSGGHARTFDGNLIYRLKNYDSSAKPKYLWQPDKVSSEERPHYYLHPDGIEKIEPVMYLGSGEPDVLTFRTVGLNNSLCWFGEKNIPDGLFLDLQSMGVEVLKVFPDLDETGRSMASKLVGMDHCGIKVEFYKLPDDLGDGGDINKLWIACGFHQEQFLGVLNELEQFTPLKTPAKLPQTTYQTPLDDFPPEFYLEIERVLGVEKYDGEGWSNPFKCIFKVHEHDHVNPAAHWHKDKKIYKCFKCGDFVLAKDTGSQLGIHWQEYITKSTPPPQNVERRKNPKPLRDISTWKQASMKLRERVAGRMPSEGKPLRVPFASIRKFGGMAKLLMPRKLVAIVADSGVGKTSFMESWIDPLRRDGENGIMWGPEWSDEEYVMRAVQRYHGPTVTQIVEHNAWLEEETLSIPLKHRVGSPLEKHQLNDVVRITTEMEGWPGQIAFITKQGLSVKDLLDRMNDFIIAMNIAGKRISWVFWDYAQLMRAGGNGRGESLDAALQMCKAFVVDHQIVGFIGSQVTKEQGMASQGGARLSQQAMQAIRPDYFNLIISLSREVAHDGSYSNRASGYIAKNSLGSLGETDLFLDPDRLLWGDLARDERETEE